MFGANKDDLTPDVRLRVTDPTTVSVPQPKKRGKQKQTKKATKPDISGINVDAVPDGPSSVTQPKKGKQKASDKKKKTAEEPPQRSLADVCIPFQV